MPKPVADPKKTVAKCWTFQSDSNSNIQYETLQYADGSTSCGCPGWTRKVDANGHRSCKHTRAVHQRLSDGSGRTVADGMAIGMVDYTKDDPNLKRVFEEAVAVRDTLSTGKRRLNL
jgi:predicted nucleic acid-binding Zn finger protein